MEKTKVITIIANDILNKMNINQILNAVRGHCIGQAEEYYNGLTDDERESLVQQIETAEAAAQEQAQSQEQVQEQQAEEPAAV